jgi:hypothetical protein
MLNHDIIRFDDLLVTIHQAMPVFDGFGERIGTVKYSQFADDSVDGYIYVEDQRVRTAPEPLRAHLLHGGYICIKTGLLAPDRFATTAQISEVSDSGVYLHAERDNLVTL